MSSNVSHRLLTPSSLHAPEDEYTNKNASFSSIKWIIVIHTLVPNDSVVTEYSRRYCSSISQKTIEKKFCTNNYDYSTPTSFSRSRHGDAGRRLHPMEGRHQKFEASLEQRRVNFFMRGCQGDEVVLDSIENNGLIASAVACTCDFGGREVTDPPVILRRNWYD